MILESRLNLSRDSWIRKKSRAIKYRAASLIKWVSCIVLQGAEDKWHCVMPLPSLALLLVLSVRINKAAVLGSGMTQCFIVFPSGSLAPLPGEGEGRHRMHPACLSQDKGRAGGPWPALPQEKEPNTLWFSPRSSPVMPWDSTASQGKPVFHCSFPPDEVRVCFSQKNVSNLNLTCRWSSTL